MNAPEPSFLRRFLAAEAASGVVLLVATAAALLWANGPWDETYESFWHGGYDLRHWVNEGLMSLFFLVVGLEVVRELREGELRHPRTAALPVVAAVGGMGVPAALYLAVEGGPGWGIPVATDIAFAVGVLALFGRRVPVGLKLFLLTLAVVDDIGAVLVIAVAYSDGVEPFALLVAAGLLLLVWRTPFLSLALVLSALVWGAFLASGVHATLAGVAVAFVLPQARRVEDALHPWTGFGVLPLFALANAGVAIDTGPSRIGWAVAVGLVVGKPLGITLASALAVRLRVAELPRGVGWPQIAAVGALAGIGFTVSLFVAGLAFDDVRSVEEAKVGILGGSLAAAALGAAGLTFWRSKT